MVNRNNRRRVLIAVLACLLALGGFACGGGGSPESPRSVQMTVLDGDGEEVPLEESGLTARATAEGVELIAERPVQHAFVELDYPEGYESARVEFTGRKTSTLTMSKPLEDRLFLAEAVPGFTEDLPAGPVAKVSWQREPQTASRETSATEFRITGEDVPDDAFNRFSALAEVPADGNRDGRVGPNDLNLVIDEFGNSADQSDSASRADYNEDGQVGPLDFNKMIEEFGFGLDRVEVVSTESEAVLMELSPEAAGATSEGLLYEQVLVSSPVLSVRLNAYGGSGSESGLLDSTETIQLNDPLQASWDETTVAWWTGNLLGLAEQSSGNSGILAELTAETTARPALWDDANGRLVFAGDRDGSLKLWSTALDGSGAEQELASFPGSGPLGLFELNSDGSLLIVSRGETDLEQQQFPDLYMVDLDAGTHTQLAEQESSEGKDLLPGDWVPDSETFVAGVIDINLSFPPTFSSELFKFTPQDFEGSSWTDNRDPLTGRFDSDGSGQNYLVSFGDPDNITLDPTAAIHSMSTSLDQDWEPEGSAIRLSDSASVENPNRLPGIPALRDDSPELAIPYRTQTDNPEFSLLLQDHSDPENSLRHWQGWTGGDRAMSNLNWLDGGTLLSLNGGDTPAFLMVTVPDAGGSFSEQSFTGPRWTSYELAESGSIVTSVAGEANDIWLYPSPVDGPAFQESSAQKLDTGVGGTVQGVLLPDGFQVGSQ